MMYETFRAAWLCHEIKRYHMIDLNRTQDLAQHSFRVAFLSRRIAEFALELGATGVDPDRAFFLGASHDLDEMVTGDIPSHTKIAIKRKGVDVSLLANKDAFPGTPPEYKDIIKMADLIEAFYYCDANANTHRAKDVRGYVCDQMHVYHIALRSRNLPVHKAADMVMAEINRIESETGDYDLQWPEEHDV